MKKLPLYFIVFLIACMACGRGDRSVLDEAMMVIREQKEYALLLLDEIDQPDRLKGKDKADYWWIKSLAHSRNSTSMANDSLLLFSLDYYQQNKDSGKLVETYILAGKYFEWIGQQDSVVTYLLKGLEIAKQLNDTGSIKSALSHLGFHDFWHKNRKRTAGYKKELLRYNGGWHHTYYLIGITDEYSDSLRYFWDKSVEMALEKGDTLYAAHYLRNYAGMLHRQKKYDEAITYINRTGELSEHYKDFGPNHGIMAEIYLDKGELDSAQHYLDKAKRENDKSSFGEANPLNLIASENIDAILQNVIRYAKGERLELDHIGQYNDSVINSFMQQNEILKGQIKDLEMAMKQNSHLYRKKQQAQRTLLLSLFLFLGCGGGVYIWLLTKRRKYREIEERTETLQHLFREALNVKDIKEENSLLFRKTLIQQLGMIRLIATHPGKPNKELLGQIINISDESISTDTLLKWNDLYPVIDSVYDDFHTNLIRRYGNILSEKEIRLCCLLRAGFSTGEISAVMQQSNQTIYQRKSNIRKKIGAGEKEDIYVFLNEKFSESV